jgi:site-specific recombinase XerD
MRYGVCVNADMNTTLLVDDSAFITGIQVGVGAAPQTRPDHLRRHFASRLVQIGVPLNTVRDLLGHSSVAMSLRYAHLAPDQRREAVAKLNQKPLLALTVRLP